VKKGRESAADADADADEVSPKRVEPKQGREKKGEDVSQNKQPAQKTSSAALVLFLHISLSPSLTHFHLLTRTHTHSHALTRTHTHSHALSLTLTHTLFCHNYVVCSTLSVSLRQQPSNFFLSFFPTLVSDTSSSSNSSNNNNNNNNGSSASVAITFIRRT